MLQRYKRHTAATLLCLAGIATALVIAEAGLRAFLPQQLLTPYTTVMHGSLFWFPPHKTIRHRSPYFDVTYTTNRLGFRGPERPFSKPSNVYRIIALGDSYTWGHGVAEPETYCARLEALLNGWSREHSQGIRYEVVNLGMPGTNLSIHDFIYSKAGIRFQSDMILLNFYSHAIFREYDFRKIKEGDLRETEGGSADPRMITRVQRVRTLFRSLPAYAFLCEHSHLWAFLRLRLSQFLVADAIRRKDADLGIRNERERVEILQRMGIGLFDALANHACKTHRTLIVLSINDWLSRFDLITQHLHRRASREGCVRMLTFDVEPKYVFAGDPHWNPAGHALVADEIFKGLKPLLAKRFPLRH